MIDEERYNTIRQEFETRQKANPNFSLRSYARWLGISPAQVSQLISGKRKLSYKMAKKVAERLGLSPREKIDLFESLNPELMARKKHLKPECNRKILDEDEFSLIADWPHYSILSLGETSKAKCDPRWIARRLGIDATSAQQCFQRLQRLGAVTVTGNSYRQSGQLLVTSTDIVSKAIQRHHKQNLMLAYHKIDSVKIQSREYSSVTMAINPSKINKAKRLIEDFKRNISSLLEEGEKKEVYTLSIQLFPNTNLKE